MSRAVLIKLDEGTKFRWRIIDSETGAYVSANDATEIVFTFLKPDGTTTVEKKLSDGDITVPTMNGTFNLFYLAESGELERKEVTVSAEKWAQYIVEADMLDPSSGFPWRLQCRAEFSDGKFSTEEFLFLVKRKMGT